MSIKYMQLRNMAEFEPTVRDQRLPSEKRASLVRPPAPPVPMNPAWKPDRKFQEINVALLDKEFPQYCAFVRAIIWIWNCLFSCCGNQDEGAKIMTSAIREGIKVADVVSDAKEAAPLSLQYKYDEIAGRESFLKGDFVEALDAFEEVPDEERTPEFYLFQGQALLESGQLHEASKAFQKTRTFSTVGERVTGMVKLSLQKIQDLLQQKLNAPGNINNLEIEKLLDLRGENEVVKEVSPYGHLKLAFYYADKLDCMRSCKHFEAAKKHLSLGPDQEQAYKSMALQRLVILKKMLENGL